MKIDTFATLDAVLRGGTFAAAAAARNVTPSAVSMQMKQLEAYMGQPLFDRSGLQVRSIVGEEWLAVAQDDDVVALFDLGDEIQHCLG